MSSSRVQPDIAKVRLTAEKAKKACLEMKQAGEELEQALLQLEAEAQAHKPVRKS
ncbi:MAG: hypothetical protein KME29_18850 [Calothrix sp. FI2-JRJ7]|jgi:hypothetical protein|nr:hypothetical protein [Calothrix sp. FI2-JRJ7]